MENKQQQVTSNQELDDKIIPMDEVLKRLYKAAKRREEDIVNSEYQAKPKRRKRKSKQNNDCINLCKVISTTLDLFINIE